MPGSLKHRPGEPQPGSAHNSQAGSTGGCKQLFEAIGSDGLELADISEMPLDDLHTLVRTSWNLRMRNESPRAPACLRSTFILRKDDGAWRIVLYLNHQDMNKLFSELASA